MDCAEPVGFIYHLFLNQPAVMGVGVYTSPLLKAFCGFEALEEGDGETDNPIRIPAGEPALLDALEKLLATAKQTDATVQKM